MTQTIAKKRKRNRTRALASRCYLWVDGVGCFLVVTGETVTIGSPARGVEAPDVAVMAPIARQQAMIVRAEEGYLLDVVGEESGLGGRLLRSDETFSIGHGVTMRLRVPNPLSPTAVLTMESVHRIEPRCDGVILLDQSCVLGPAADAHIQSAWGSASLVIFERKGALWCKAVTTLEKNGVKVDGESPLTNGDILTTDDLRLRVEFNCAPGG